MGVTKRGASRTRAPSATRQGLVPIRPSPNRDVRELGPRAAVTRQGLRGVEVSAQFSRLETTAPRELGRRWWKGS